MFQITICTEKPQPRQNRNSNVGLPAATDETCEMVFIEHRLRDYEICSGVHLKIELHQPFGGPLLCFHLFFQSSGVFFVGLVFGIAGGISGGANCEVVFVALADEFNQVYCGLEIRLSLCQMLEGYCNC